MANSTVSQGDLATLTKSIKAIEKQQAEFKSWLEQPASSAGKLFAVPRDAQEEGKWGFKSFSHYLESVKAARDPAHNATLKGQISKAMGSSAYYKAALGLNEAVDSEGGFLVPPTFSNNIFQRVYENDLLSKTDKYTVTGNSMEFPRIDETSRVDGSRFGGVQAYWADEANTVTATKPKFNRLTLKLKKLMALGYVTDELLADAGTAMDTFLTKQFAGEIEFKVGNAIINGNGAAQPRGILNSDAVVSVAKETGQAAKTIVFENIVNMWARMWAPSRKSAVWFINQDTEPQLSRLVVPGTMPAIPAYMPPGGLSDAPYGTLMGRPVIAIEFAQTLGTVGDIILADLSQYCVISKGSVDTQTSVHLRFDYDEMAYRTTFRMDGDSWWKTALTPFKGTNTQSPSITLATRA